MGISIDEFVGKLDKMAAAYGSDASDVLEEGAKDMKKALRRATPVGPTEHKHKLRKSWEMEVIDRLGQEPEAHIRSTAPHFHLVNRGVQHPTDAHGNPKPEWLDALNKHVGYMQKTVEEHWPEIQKKMAEGFYGKVRGHLG